jgi:hypothetical protein
MNTDLQDIQQCVDAPSRRAEPYFAVHERLAIAALVTAVTLWIRVVEVLPDNRHRY